MTITLPIIYRPRQAHIRLLEKSDLAALEWGGEYTHFRRLYHETFNSMRQGKVLMWVIESPGVGVFGQMFVQLSGARVELADGVTRAYLYSFRIQPAYRCQGLGSRFLCFVEEDLVQRRFIWASLNVGRDNPAARRFYERHGYRIVATEPGRWSYLDDRGHRQQVHEPAWRMQKSLPPGHVKDR